MYESNGRPEPIDTMLEQFSRIALPGEVESRLRSRYDAFRDRAESPPPAKIRFNRRLRWALASAAAASVLFVALFLFGSRDVWAQVVESLRSKPWVRFTLQIPKGEQLPEEYPNQPPEFWFSAHHRVGAGKFGSQVQFCDFVRGERFRYDPLENTVLHESTSEHDSAEYEHLNTLLRLVADGDREAQLPVSPIECLERNVRELRDGERRLTEFTFRCRDSKRSPPDYVLTLRVDSESRLPLEMTSTEKFSPDDKALVRTYTFDYPQTGPADIYALGAPRSAKVVDRRLPKGARELIAAHQKAGSRRIEPYTALVLVSDTASAFTDLHFAARVRFDGQNWFIEEVDRDQFVALREQVGSKQLTPHGGDLAVWWKDEIATLTFSAATQVAPAGDTRIPDGVLYQVNTGWGAEMTIDRRATGNWPSAIQMTIRTPAGGNTHWFDPDHDYAEVRLEMDTMDHAWPYRAIIVDKLEKSPGGRLYATQVRVGDVQRSGDEPRTDSGVAPVVTSLYRYFVKFDSAN